MGIIVGDRIRSPTSRQAHYSEGRSEEQRVALDKRHLRFRFLFFHHQPRPLHGHASALGVSNTRGLGHRLSFGGEPFTPTRQPRENTAYQWPLWIQLVSIVVADRGVPATSKQSLTCWDAIGLMGVTNTICDSMVHRNQLSGQGTPSLIAAGGARAFRALRNMQFAAMKVLSDLLVTDSG